MHTALGRAYEIPRTIRFFFTWFRSTPRVRACVTRTTVLVHCTSTLADPTAGSAELTVLSPTTRAVRIRLAGSDGAGSTPNIETAVWQFAKKVIFTIRNTAATNFAVSDFLSTVQEREREAEEDHAVEESFHDVRP